VDNTGGLVSNKLQTVAYNGFNKAYVLTDSIGNDAYRLDITYGPDMQRWKTVQKKNNSLQKTIIFAGDYESVTEGSTTKQLYYVSGGDGLVAVYVKQAGQADKIYYVCTDHLESIIKLVDANGTEVFKASYDAWGRQMVANNSFAFHRGYTGHEHLAEFGLINMNGRMYDPVLGRFLSPDPYVQSPLFSQNFNRYAYCLNNPLLYTDPTGEYFGIDDLIAAAIGGVVNLIVNACQGNLGGHGFWGGVGRGFAAFGAGAVGGWGALYPEFGGWAWGGATVGATNSWLSGAKGWDIAVGAGVSVVSGVVGGAAGQWGGQYLGGVIINGTSVTSPVLQGAITGTVGGYAGGFTAGLIMTGDLGEANSAGWKGAAFGAPIGGISGSVSAYRYAVKNDINPWNGSFNKSVAIGEGMDARVTPAAADLKAETIARDWESNNIRELYIGKDMPSGKGLDFNAQWIQNKIDNNYHIFDLGPRGTSVSSPYYNLEVGRTLSYPYLHPTNTYNMSGIRIIRFKY
jgi:RHS repeat-associated protein